MRYEWDPAKDAENRRKHGIAFEISLEALDDPNRSEWVDDSDFYGEERIVTLGFSRQGILYVVSTERGLDVTRVISARRANKHEQSWYYHGGP
jgi:uncharacterized DUF497 family protein